MTGWTVRIPKFSCTLHLNETVHRNNSMRICVVGLHGLRPPGTTASVSHNLPYT